MGLLYRLTGLFPSNEFEFVSGLNKNKPVTVSVVTYFEKSDDLEPKRLYFMNVSQSLFFSHTTHYPQEGEYREMNIPQEREGKWYPKRLCYDVEELKKFLNSKYILCEIEFIEIGKGNLEQIIVN